MTTFPKEALKSALIELAQSDRAFFASLIADLMSDSEPANMPKPDIQDVGTQPAKITPAYRKNVKVLRKKYAMDKSVLLKLQDLFEDGPPAEEFLQTAKL
ncbi:MAG: hypothetical protein HUU01_01685 [Saprospiraceae bacterium]|nr:hypothetical protein [Saprospiraceae bacterium]